MYFLNAPRKGKRRPGPWGKGCTSQGPRRMEMSACRGSQSRCSLPVSVWIWSWVGRAVLEIARASRLFLTGEKCSNWLRPSDLCSSRRHEKRKGGEVASWRHLEQVAFGSFLLGNHEPRVTGLEQWWVDQQNTAPLLETAAAFTVVEIWKAFKVRNISFGA